MRFHFQALDKQDRADFDCGVEALNAYFHRQVSQDTRRHSAKCFIAVEVESQKIACYYTLSACHVALNSIPEPWAKKLPRYTQVPAALLGRLAVDRAFRGLKLGSAALDNAAQRAARADLAAALLVVDAKDTAAEEFYKYHGLVADPENSKRLFIPLKSLLG